jgi:hypothetical protein
MFEQIICIQKDITSRQFRVFHVNKWLYRSVASQLASGDHVRHNMTMLKSKCRKNCRECCFHSRQGGDMAVKRERQNSVDGP